jgi:hypothetical protein
MLEVSSMSNGRKRIATRILGAALLLPIVLFSTMSTSFALWRCQSDGVARSHCCCPRKATAQPQEAVAAAPTATISRQACCGIQRVDLPTSPPAELTGPRLPHPAVALALAPAAPHASLAPALPAPCAARDRTPADDGPPTGRTLILQKRSLLI